MDTITLQGLWATMTVEVVIFVLLTFACSFLLYFPFITMCLENGWVDKPDTNRKVHKLPVPTSGGILFIGVFIVALVFFSHNHPVEGLPFLVIGLVLALLLGVMDDKKPLSSNVRLFAHFVISVAIVWVLDLKLDSFFGLMGIREVPPFIAISLGVLTMMSIINALNFIDGIDGLSGSISMLASMGFCVGFAAFSELPWAGISCIFAASIAGFLLHNKQPATVFMGDAGSISVGYMLGIQALMFLDVSSGKIPPTAVGELLMPIAPIFAMALLCIPLFDLLQVVVMRLINRRSPFLADQRHIHHILLQQGLSHSTATSVCVVWSLMMVSLVLLLADVLPPTILFLVILNAMVIFLLAIEIVPYLIYKLVREK